MRAMLVCPYSLSVPGGVQAQVLGLARALRVHGVDASVVAPCDDAPPEPGVIPVGRSVPLASNGSVAPIALDPSAAARTLAAIRGEQPDVLHLHEPLSPGPTLAALLGSAVPKVGTFHASGSAPAALYRVFRPIVRAAARRLAVRTAVSEDARGVAERALGGAYRVLPNAVDVDRFAKAEPWPRPEGGRPVILFVGRHEERKGLAVLLEAFVGVGRETTLWVAGEGPQTKALRAREVPGVEWLGCISDTEKARRMRAATVFCAPSLGGESFGIVLLEAMAAGVPVLASDIPGYRDVARPGREAALVPPADPSALRDALLGLLEHPGATESLVEAGRARAARFSLSRLAERYVDVYEAAIRF